MKTLRYFLLMLVSLSGIDVIAQSIATGAISGNPFCPGATINVPFTITGTFNNTNIFRVQLSNATGTFPSTPVVIGSVTSRVAGTISATIPSNATAGTNYRVRVVSTSPIITGTASATVLTIKSTFNCSLAGSSIDELGDVAIASPSNGQVLTYNGTNWVNNTASGWSLTGNNGVIGTTHFIGTLNAAPLAFRVNNLKAGLIDNVNGNTSFGYTTLTQNTGINNTAMGSGTLFSNTSGFNNVAIGFQSLYANTTGYFNTAVGVNALLSNTNGLNNTAMGFDALNGNTEGRNNTAVGIEALKLNTTGTYNTAIGGYSLRYNTGDLNSGHGFNALYSNTTGTSNTGTGFAALQNNTTGNQNTGHSAYALYSNTTGSDNTGVGYYANVSAGNLTNATAIGSKSLVACSNCLILGSVAGQNSATANSRVGIGTTAPNASAALEVKSVTQGILIPRMTQAQREAIVSPAEGLLVYQSNNTKGFWYFDGSVWVNNFVAGTPATAVNTTFAIANQSGANLLEAPELPLLAQNIPNPFNSTTVIPFRVSSNCKDATIVITSTLNGQIVKAIPVACSETQVNINASKLSSGTYLYSLYVDGKAVQTKKMTLSK